MNFVPAQIVADNGGLAARLADGTQLLVPASRSGVLSARRDQPVLMGVRPEHISRAIGEDARAGLARYGALIELVQPTGSRTYATFRLSGAEVVAELHAHDVSQSGERIDLAIDMNRAVMIDPGTEKVI